MSDNLEFLKKRHNRIGGSEAPIIMGNSPYKTILQLYEEKILAEPTISETNYAMQVGIDLEPRIRALFEMLTGKSYQPAMVVREDFPWLGASLDGYSECKTEIIEIKFSGKADWEGTKMGFVPDKYVAQLQHCLMATNAVVCHYLSYPYDGRHDKILDPKKLAHIKVMPDPEYQINLFNLENIFWNENVLKRVPPKLSDKDFVPLTGLSLESSAYKRLCKQIEAMEIERDHLKETLLEHARKSGYVRLLCAGIKITHESRIGNVDYSKIEVLSGLDLEQYRKPSTKFWKVTNPK